MSNNTAQIFSFEVTTEGGEKFGPFDLPDASGPYYFVVRARPVGSDSMWCPATEETRARSRSRCMPFRTED